MAKKKRRSGNLTPEDHARYEETSRMVQERIAYHEAKAREQEEARLRAESAWWRRVGRRLALR